MKTIVARIRRGGGKTLNYLSAVIFALALCAALTARAADWTDATNATYTALKSIKGGGSAYIVTAITPAGTETVKLKFSPTVIKSKTTGSNEALFCSREPNVKKQFAGFKLANKIRIDRNGVQGTSSASLPAANSDYAIVADFANGTASIDGTPTTFNNELGTEETDPYKPTQPLYLYASHESESNIGYKGYYWLYYFQMYSSAGELQHNFMPAKRDSDNVIGVYDTVQRKFYAPSGGSFANSSARTVTAPSGCKKWTGLGADNKMSTEANWEGGVAPQAGDDLDFTLAPPLAEINADMNVTFGKVWIDDGDLPGFTGTLTATAINDLERMTAYDTATAGFTFMLAAPSGQDFTWNGGADANWNTTDASWLYNSAASVWYDHNNAIFNTADATVTLTENAEPDALVFNQNATVGGTATLTVPSVSVAADAAATIAAQTADALTKTGAGTLTLTQNRTSQTTVEEGTLAMSSGATVHVAANGAASLTLGTSDPTKPVVFDYGGQTLTATPVSYLVNGSNVTLSNGVFQAGGGRNNMTIRDDASDSAIPAVLTIAKDATLSKYGTTDGSFVINTQESESTINVVGGTLHSAKYGYIQHGADTGTLRINVTDSGTFSFAGATRILCSGIKPEVAKSPKFYLSLDHSTFKVGELYFGFSSTYFPAEPTGVVAATNSTVIIPTVTIGRNASDNYNTGSYTFDFEGCTVTTKTFTVNHDRPLNNARFNGTRLVFSANSGSLVANTDAANWFTVGDDGLTIDTQNFSATLNANLGGSGVVTKVGTGTLTVASNQTATAALNVSEGTLAVNGGVSIARPLTAATGTTLALSGVTQSSFGAVTLEAGSTIDIATPATDVAAFAATSLNLPADGTVTLTSGGGAFVEGLYAICEMSGVTAADGAKFAPSAGTLAVSWSVDGDMLMLAVGDIDPNTWTGRAGDGNLSNPENWLGRAVPTSGTATINTSGALTVGDVFSPDVIVFPETCGAVTIAGQNAITGVSAITNLSSSTCTFEVPVAFADKIDVYQPAYYSINASSGDNVLADGGHVRFAGGVTGTGFAEGTTRRLDGAYTIPATAGWVANTTDNVWTLPGSTEAGTSSLTITGSSYEVPGTTDTSRLLIGDGGAFTTGVVRTSIRLSYRIYGEYVVTDELEVALTRDTYIAQRHGGTYKFEKLTLSDDGGNCNFYVANFTSENGTKHLYIGAGGINVNGTAGKSTALVCGYDNQNSHDVTHLHPWHSDYAINGKGGSTRDLLIYRTTYLHTDDENGVPRTVTLNGIADVRAALTINGSGKLQVNSDGMNGGGIGNITVTDSATLAYASGADLGAGAVTVGVNATMEVASGVHTFGGLTLNDGATLAFNFTDRRVAPQIAVAEGKTLTVNGAVKVKIADGSLRPTGGEKRLTTCGGFTAANVTLVEGAPKWVRGLSANAEGNIVLDVKPMGTVIIFR